MKYLCYAITIRPKYGVNEIDFKIVDNFLSKCEYYYVITEKTGESRHIHAVLYLKKEQRISDFNRWWCRKYTTPDQKERGIYKYMFQSKVCYNDDFYEEYLQKDDETCVIQSKMPEKDTRLKYYKDIVIKSKVIDYQMDKLEKMWNGEEGKNYGWNDTSQNPLHIRIRKADVNSVERFLCNLMFNLRRIKVVQNATKMRRLCKTLVAYINRSSTYPWEMKDNMVGSVHQPPRKHDLYSGL